MSYTVKAVAYLAGITVRALHHYDRIGLLRPSWVSPAGYRLYSDQDLRDLQQILFFRELSFPLAEIARIVRSPDFDRRAAFLDHRRLLEARRERLDRLVAAVDSAIVALERGSEVENDKLFNGLDSAEYEQYRNEASERWGKDVVDASYERVAKLSKPETAAIRAEAADIEQALLRLLGRPPADPDVQRQIGRWHKHLRHYHDFSAEAFRGLGDLYVDDERFRAYYEKRAPGLAAFMRAAMRVWADQASDVR